MEFCDSSTNDYFGGRCFWKIAKETMQNEPGL